MCSHIVKQHKALQVTHLWSGAVLHKNMSNMSAETLQCMHNNICKMSAEKLQCIHNTISKMSARLSPAFGGLRQW